MRRSCVAGDKFLWPLYLNTDVSVPAPEVPAKALFFPKQEDPDPAFKPTHLYKSLRGQVL